MKRKNMISMVTGLALVGVVAVGGTLALLTSETESLKNTFTVGDGYDPGDDDTKPDFVLWENEVEQGADGGYVKKEENIRTDDGQMYSDLVSGTTLAKNPFFELKDRDADGKTPPDSWVVAKINADDVNQLTTNGVYFKDAGASWYLVTATATEDDEGAPVWSYSIKDGMDAFDTLTVDDLNNLYKNTTATKKFYFIYSEKLNVTSNSETDPLFETLEVKTLKNGVDDFYLNVSGVAVQALQGYDLNDPSYVSAIMKDAVSKLG